ncbi:ATP-binding cassette domain-containing protein [Mesorhizobium sp. NBSH29]|uniref:putative B6 ABC transporter ATP-binding protein n=1 Tax=Mesorhizobium sp. NBSH29 TaxID=2654249 RepID=UPI0018967BF5|nr:ABC transporter ATP-binding protein [Mesorhizobium sp. NBSH29]QPC86234.1 ATP-binding cassette domain-containing protein [Mesorhizobium sp. NBSH29]
MVTNNEPSRTGQAIVTLERVTKRFPGIVANDQVDLAICAGEVHVLLGENGAGKSTLIGMLSGLLQPDSGRILIDGTPMAIRSPRHALALGIGTVFQHNMLVPTLTVAENLALGGSWWQRPGIAALTERVQAIVQPLGIDINLDAHVSELSLGEQQQVEIVRALLRDSRLLILDEATSMLTPRGIAELGALMRRLVERGLAVVFITHKLNEAAEFGDRVSVLKLGRKIGEIAPERLRQLEPSVLVDEIVTMMFGRQAGDSAVAIPARAANDEALLSVRDLTVAATADAPGLDSISFDIGRGEILGVAGIDGNGQKQMAEALSGQRPAGGRVTLAGEQLDGLNVAARRRHGLRYLTDDRLGEGTVGSFPVSINYFLKQIGEPPLWSSGIQQTRRIDARAKELTRLYDVRTPSVATPIGRLSGGNIQKVLIARELADGARAVIFNKPTYGLDLANTLATRQRIRDIASQDLAVLLISTDLEELLSMCHRIAVIAQGRLVGTVANGEDAAEKVGRLMIGLAA